MTSTLLSVFVYGTLKPGGFYYKQYCEGRVVASYEAIALGQLYDLPLGYPAMTTGNDPVRGYVLEFNQPEVLQDLDELEGYDPQRSPDQNEYERVWVEVFDRDRHSLGFAWTYVMTTEQALSLGGVLLPQGVWICNQPIV
ncbi:MAG: gamma-glutamylcyclotransferase [Oculatellaceae cyanobacterium bins.114]|nr:gamma-glutamylcyclotransferase [Oculatellaceae cyanobacterium bins.114]